jgi:hypothetical protein
MNDLSYSISAENLFAAAISGEYVWATSDAARNRALSLLLVGSIARKYGGTVRVNQETYAIHVDVPDEGKVGCAQEIEKRVGSALH